MERTTRMTEERLVAQAPGAFELGRAPGAGATPAGVQIQKRAGLVPTASGPGLVCGSSTVAFHTNDHAAMGRTAWDGTPLAPRGAGYG